MPQVKSKPFRVRLTWWQNFQYYWNYLFHREKWRNNYRWAKHSEFTIGIEWGGKV